MVAIAGDSHGDKMYISWCVSQALKHGHEFVIIVGDWGFFTESNRNNCNSIVEEAGEGKVRLCFLGGNHDNWEYLNSIGRHTNELVQVCPYIFFIPQGCFFLMDGLRFASMGGAYSVDHAHREQGVDWWPHETISEDDLRAFYINWELHQYGDIDIFLSHEGPDIPELVDTVRPLYKQTEDQMRSIGDLMYVAHPKYHIHGHHHRFYTCKVGDDCEYNITVVGLDANCDTSSRTYLTTEFEKTNSLVFLEGDKLITLNGEIL